MKRLAPLLCALALVIASSCALAPGSGKPLVLATTTIFADLAMNVAGDRLTVESIAPAGVEVEEYAPRPEDARRVAVAKAVFVNGHDLDRWSAALLKGSPAKIVTLTDGLPTIEDNPHLWFDVQLARKYVEKIRDTMIEIDGAGRDGYTQRARDYSAKLDALDAELKAKAQTIPAARRVLVTAHDAFPYFAKAYGFRIVGFVQPEAGKDPSPAELARLVAAVKAGGVPAIFAELGGSPRLVDTLAKEAGVKNVVADLPTDSVGEAPADSYVGVMRVIMDKIVTALR